MPNATAADVEMKTSGPSALATREATIYTNTGQDISHQSPLFIPKSFTESQKSDIQPFLQGELKQCRSMSRIFILFVTPRIAIKERTWKLSNVAEIGSYVPIRLSLGSWMSSADK